MFTVKVEKCDGSKEEIETMMPLNEVWRALFKDTLKTNTIEVIFWTNNIQPTLRMHIVEGRLVGNHLRYPDKVDDFCQVIQALEYITLKAVTPETTARLSRQPSTMEACHAEIASETERAKVSEVSELTPPKIYHT